MLTGNVTCDACGADLTDSGPMPAYRTVLDVETVPNKSGIRDAVIFRPWLNRAHHFCGRSCLRKWLEGMPA